MNRLGRWTNLLCKCALLITVIGSFCFGVRANLDLSSGRAVLFMDEVVTFDGVRQILHPEGALDFLLDIVDGGDHRYGRILWNVSALFSAVPERLLGGPGQIVATRIAQHLVLITAYFLLSFSFLRTWPGRALGLLALLALPTTPYYSSMPKPEPIQLLALALFMVAGKRRGFSFGPHWLFLGMAFGAKISALPLLPVFLAIGWVQRIPGGSPRCNARNAVLWFALGFVLAEPYPLLAIVRLDPKPFLGYLSSTFLSTGHGSDDPQITWLTWVRYLFDGYGNSPPPLLAALFAAGAGLMALKICDIAREGGMEHFHLDRSAARSLVPRTLMLALVTGLLVPAVYHASRRWDPSLSDFLVSMFTAIYPQEKVPLLMPLLPGIKMALLAFISLLFFLLSTVLILNKEDARVFRIATSFFRDHADVILLLSGTALFLPILLAVKRLWGFYLHNGFSLAVLGLVSISENFLAAKGLGKHSAYKLTAAIFVSLLCAQVMIFEIPASVRKYERMSRRTATDEHRQKMDAYAIAEVLIARSAAAAGRKVRVYYDPYLYNLESDDRREIVWFWGPFRQWEEGADIVFALKGNLEMPRQQPGTVPYRKLETKNELLAVHVRTDLYARMGEGRSP